MYKTLLLALLGLTQASGCSFTSRDKEPAWNIPIPEIQYAEATSGSLYRAGSSLILFDDRKAARVGDLLTVLLVENIDASKSSSTNTQKDSNLASSVPSLLGRAVTSGGLPVFDSTLTSSNGFSGSGDTQQSNRLAGSVSVTVVGRQANGNLVIEGRKKIELNQGSEFVSIAGVIRPEDISTTNEVNSDRIAHAQISYSGKGPINDANRMGFIMRFFNSPWSLN